MTPRVLGLGTALPPYLISQELAAHAAANVLLHDPPEARRRLLATLYRRTNVRQRGSVVLENPGGEAYRQAFYRAARSDADRGPGTAERMARYALAARDLARNAAQAALLDAGLAPAAVTHLITVSCTGFDAPGVDVHLIKSLGLPATTPRVHVGFMGCHGAINGLRVAQALSAADSTARPLVCAVEACSLHLSYGWDPDRVVANALFADGAGAVVVGQVAAALDPSGASLDSRSSTLASSGAAVSASAATSALPDTHGGGAGAGDADVGAWSLAATGSCLLPDSEDAMTWRIGDHGFEMTLSARVPALIAEHLRPWLVRWLADCGVSLPGVAAWAIHPGGPRIVGAVAESLALTESQVAASNAVLADCGNMSSPTVLFILDRLRRAGPPRPCVALGFGPGLVAEALLLR